MLLAPKHLWAMNCRKSWSFSRRGASAAAIFLLVLVGAVGANARADWPEWRGPSGDGQVPPAPGGGSVGLPLHWSDTENIRWKTAIPFQGWSTPAVAAGQLWLTTATPDGHDFFVVLVDAATGAIRSNEKLFHCENPEPLGNPMNSYATPSPVLEAGRVYVHFGSYGTACLDTATGKTLWQRQDLRCRHYRGPASSPVIFENLLILTMDGVDLQYLVALDKQTGKTVWQTPRSVAWNDENVPGQMARDGDLRKAHSTPLIVKANGKPQMLTAGAKAAYGYEPRTGQELWRVRYDAWSAAPRPLYDQGMAFIVTGFGGKTELLGIRVDGQGDVTATHVAWRFDTMVSKTASPLLVDGLIYMVSDDGLASCLEAKTGTRIWRERLGGKFAASPICGDGRLYFFNQEGKTTVLKPGRTCEIVATNSVSGSFMASPAVDGKAFILRTKTHLLRVEAAAGAAQ